ncbi:unnamed protein product [Cylindrotheca closterium]|uniref:J domain-containing protein n=1 Tax=Cylindrotheca closterium TaxID=2856 RepID=A0AAD2JNE3_9STRA|nr:unnamed protein product [Cylindrotheca closterium]
MTVDESWGMVQENESGEEMSTSEYSFGSVDSDESFMDLANSFGRSFDINMLKESIETGSKILEHVTNKNVVLVIGKTGAGKSTFIQGIAGKELHETVHVTMCDGKAVEKSVYDAKEALPEFIIGHSKSSQTKAFCFFVPPKQDGKEEIVYIDTPGFEDTRHEEIDIATSVMLSHIAKKCKSLRFVVLINYTSLLEDRGGAARSILRFTRAFVKDFSKDKKGFMFLFTHTNEISGVSDDLASSRKALLEEISRLRADSDTSDKDLLGLLDFLKISLLKRYPFIDVLHPMESNFETLKSSIEKKLSKIKSPTMAESCGLTGASRNRLTGEITSIMLRSRQHLQSEPPNVQVVRDNHELLQYLSSEINFSEVQKATDESSAWIERFVQHSKRSIEDEISKGGVNDEMFYAASAKHVREMLEQLDILGVQKLSECFFRKIGDVVSVCCCSLQLDRSVMSHSSIRTLNKLSCWCNAFPEFVDQYTAAIEELKSAIAKNIETINQFNCDGEVDPEAISGFMDSVCLLNSILRNMDPLMNHDLDFDNMKNAREHSLTVARQLLFSLNEDDSDALGVVALDEESLENLSARIGVLEAMRLGLSAVKDFADLASIAGERLASLQGNVSTHFEAMCDDVKKSGIDQVRVSLQRLQAVLNRCYGIAGLASGEMHRNFQNLLGIVEQKFRSASESLLRIALPMDSAECVLKGGEAGVALNEFAQHIWFDELLPEGISIIAETCDTVRDANERFCQTIRKEIVDHLDIKKLKTTDINELQKACRFKSIATLKQVKIAYNRFLEIEEFAETTNNEAMLIDCNSVRSMIFTRTRRAMKAMKDLTKASTLDFEQREKARTIFVRLNAHLEEIQLLTLFTKDQEYSKRLESTRGLLLATVNGFVEVIEASFKSETDFKAMASILLVLSELDYGDSHFVNSLLPSLPDLISQARQAVMKSVDKVQKLVSATSNWEEINLQMTLLNGALALDSFLEGDVAIQLQTLKAFREGKETRVDSRIDEMIAAEDYLGIGELLSPLANSKDQLKRKKFSTCILLIEAALEMRSGKSLDFLPRGLPPMETTFAIVQNLDKLKEADQELFKHTKFGSYPRELRNLKESISKDMKKLKSTLNQKLRQSLEQLESDLSDFRIGRIAADRKAVMRFTAAARKHIFGHNSDRLKKVLDHYDKILASVPKLVTQFFDSWFKDGKDLVTILRSLRRASLSGNPETVDIAELYNKTKNDLNDRLDDAILEIETVVGEQKCYGDGINVFRSLQRCVDSGLREHIIDQSIFKIEELMEAWHSDGIVICNQSKGEHEGAYLEIAATLDRLDPSGPSLLGFKKLKAWYCGEEYNSLRTYTEKVCRTIYNRGMTAMRSRNLDMVDKCLQHLIAWNAAVGKHVKAVATNIKLLQNCLETVYLDVCEKLKSAVQGTSTLHCKSLFDEFRQILVEAPSILQMDDCRRAYALTNQLFCEKLEGEVAKVKDALQLKQPYDFLEIKVIVEDVRSFGDFMADHYAVLFEEVKHKDIFLKRIAEVCHEHFKDGRDFGNIRHYIALGLAPSASHQDIKRAYHVLMKRFHPDKMANRDDNTSVEKCKRLNEAWEALNDVQRSSTVSEGKPFSRLIHGVRDCLLAAVRGNLRNQQYEAVAQLLGRLYAVRELEDLVSPPLDSKHIEESVTDLVRNHVERLRVSVKSHWSERHYKELQQDIDDLKLMEKHFKSASKTALVYC